jgi:hypothetical protein
MEQGESSMSSKPELKNRGEYLAKEYAKTTGDTFDPEGASTDAIVAILFYAKSQGCSPSKISKWALDAYRFEK